jgi:uncharacterized protein (DUF983 family)
MNGPVAFCPNCKKDVLFIDEGARRRCSACGAEFELTRITAEPHWAGNVVMTIGHVLLRVALLIGVVFLVGIAVLFASCAFGH